MTLILTEDDIEKVIEMPDCLRVIEETFRDFGMGEAVSRPRSHTYTQVGPKTFYNFKSMDGCVPRYGIHALRVSSEVLQSQVHLGKMREEKLPLAPGGRYVGLIILFDINTTEPLAIMQEAGLQRMRVGATSGIAAKYLSRPDAEVVGLFGSGWQSLPQVEALANIRALKRLKVFSLNPVNKEAFARKLRDRFEFEVETTETPYDTVLGSDIIACATNSSEPVFDGDWLVPGQHVNSLQAGELDVRTLERVDIIGIRAFEKSLHFEQKSAAETPINAEKTKRYNSSFDVKLRALGDLVAGSVTGRTSHEAITLFGGSGTGPSSGLGIQFAAVGKVAYDLAKARGLGIKLDVNLFTQTHHP